MQEIFHVPAKLRTFQDGDPATSFHLAPPLRTFSVWLLKINTWIGDTRLSTPLVDSTQTKALSSVVPKIKSQFRLCAG